MRIQNPRCIAVMRIPNLRNKFATKAVLAMLAMKDLARSRSKSLEGELREVERRSGRIRSGGEVQPRKM